MSYVQKLTEKGLISPPKFLPDNIQYEALTGSISYGASDNTSDMDIIGFCIPPKENIFPHFKGEIQGFGKQIQRFEQYQQHHIKDPTAMGGKGREYDITVFNIVKFFQLVMENNPNCLSYLFTPINCVLHSTQIGQLVRDNRKLFVHKGCFPKFRGYAFSQIHKMKDKKLRPLIDFMDTHRLEIGYKIDFIDNVISYREGKNDIGELPKDLEKLSIEELYKFKSLLKGCGGEVGKRGELIRKHNYDTKFAMHCCRLLLECEQLLVFGEMDIQRDKEFLKAIRRGDLKEKEILDFFNEKEKSLEKLYKESKLPWGPDENKIKELLLNCLEIHYGKLGDDVIRKQNKHTLILDDLKLVIEKYS